MVGVMGKNENTWWCKCRRRKHQNGEWCCVDEARKKRAQRVLEKEALAAKSEKERAATLAASQN
jgi:hypothetical protein